MRNMFLSPFCCSNLTAAPIIFTLLAAWPSLELTTGARQAKPSHNKQEAAFRGTRDQNKANKSFASLSFLSTRALFTSVRQIFPLLAASRGMIYLFVLFQQMKNSDLFSVPARAAGLLKVLKPLLRKKIKPDIASVGSFCCRPKSSF